MSSALYIRGALLEGEPTDIEIDGGRITAIRPHSVGGAGASSAEGADSDGLGAGTGPSEPPRVIDGAGLHLLPALRNGHTHVAMSLFRGWGDDMPLMAWLETRIWPAEARLTAEHVRAGARLSIVELIRSGTVFFNDMYWHVDAIAEAAREMGVGAHLGSAIFDQGDEAVGARWRASVEADLERRGEFGDGIEVTIAPHAIYTVSERNLRWAAERARSAGVRLHIHLSETAGEVESCLRDNDCRPAEWLDRVGLLGPDVTVAHGNHLDRAELDLLAERGATLVHNPCANLKLATGAILDYPAAVAAGVRVVLGTDGVASNNSHDLFDELKFASLLQKHRAKDATVLPAREAWTLVTEAPARGFGLGSGRVEVGEPADLILVDLRSPSTRPDHDRYSNLVYAANGSCVSTTIRSGRVLMHDRRLEVADELEVIATAEAAAREVTGAA